MQAKIIIYISFKDSDFPMSIGSVLLGFGHPKIQGVSQT